MNKFEYFLNRDHAGEILAKELRKFSFKNPCLVGIPRGGIEIAKAIADEFKIPIHPIILKKLPIPGNPEAGFGAIAEDGTMVLNDDMIRYLGLSSDIIDKIAESIIAEIKRRKDKYGNINKDEVKSKDIILVDDGIATGNSIIAAIKSIKTMNPNSITVAVPVSAGQAYRYISRMVDNIISPIVDEPFHFAVATYYHSWYDLPESNIKEIIDSYKNKYQQITTES